MNSKPFFSIIIPSLNEEIALPILLQNLIDQTSHNFEVIHVDGKSDDQTQTLAKKLGSKLPSFKQVISPIRHVSHQRNLGASKAQGEYLLFIDADTQLPPYFLEGLSYQLHRKPTDIFTSWYQADSSNALDKAVVTIINLGMGIGSSLDAPYAFGIFMGSTPKAFKSVGGFKEDINYGEDEDFVKDGTKLGLAFTVFHHPRAIISLRRFRTEGSLITLQNMAAKKLSVITGKNNNLIKPKDYLMGGHRFRNDQNSKPAFLNFNRALKKLTSQPKKILKDLITLENLDH